VLGSRPCTQRIAARLLEAVHNGDPARVDLRRRLSMQSGKAPRPLPRPCSSAPPSEPPPANILYLLVVGLLATEALDIAYACLNQMLTEARTRASIPAQAPSSTSIAGGWPTARRYGSGRRGCSPGNRAPVSLRHPPGTAVALGLLTQSLHFRPTGLYSGPQGRTIAGLCATIKFGTCRDQRTHADMWTCSDAFGLHQERTTTTLPDARPSPT
jgi:hypothetical protein